MSAYPYRQPQGTPARLAALEEIADSIRRDIVENRHDIDDHDIRIRQLELRFAKWGGVFCALAFVGSALGTLAGHLF